MNRLIGITALTFILGCDKDIEPSECNCNSFTQTDIVMDPIKEAQGDAERFMVTGLGDLDTTTRVDLVGFDLYKLDQK